MKFNIFLFVAVSILLLNPITPSFAQYREDTSHVNWNARLIGQTNEIRFIHGKKPLLFNEQLGIAAQKKAQDMADNSYFSHTSPSGISPWVWFYLSGYKPRFAGENLALSFSVESDIVGSWLKSSMHKKNILSENFTEIGIGIAKKKVDSKDVYYFVQFLGAQ